MCYLDIFYLFFFFFVFFEGQKIGSKENFIIEFYQQFACVNEDPVFSESLCKELHRKFFNKDGNKKGLVDKIRTGI